MLRFSLLCWLSCWLSVTLLAQTSFPGTPYTGTQVQSLRVPLGGLGTGNLLMGGRGNLAHVEIFNRPDRQRQLEKTFFAIWAQAEGAAPAAKLLERELFPPFTQSTHKYVAGLPRLQEVTFNNYFPLHYWQFGDPDLPVEVSLEAFSPFIPLDVPNSSYPVVAFYWNLHNPRPQPVEASVVLSMENPIQGERILNLYHEGTGISGVRFVGEDVASPNFDGSLFMGTPHPSVDIQTQGYHGTWRDEAHVFWDDFSEDGRLTSQIATWETRYQPTAYNEGTDRMAAVLARVTLAPGETRRIPFYLAWHFPRRVFEAGEVFGIAEATDVPFENAYAQGFADEMAVLAQFREQEAELHARTANFAHLLASATYPEAVKEALTTQAATLRTHLIQLTAEGDVHGFEGVLPAGWCCPGTCTHVWNYEQALASLFPSLERRMREIEFLHNTFDNGFQVHRSVIPLGDYWFSGPAAADGQMGTIVRAYREWKLSGDDAWLERLWPRIRRALEFAWTGPGEVTEARFQHQMKQSPWDPQQSGLLSGLQHNTYDINFYGPSSMTSSLYLAALQAGAEMAAAMDEPQRAQLYLEILEKGKKAMVDSLWNGQYFIQLITDPPGEVAASEYEPTAGDGKAIPKYQYGDGCLADQLLGQYLAFNAGLGYLVDSQQVDQALAAIYTHNFIRPLRDFANVQRVYGLNDEGGVVLCTWPQGNRPALPFVYSDEIWTGVEFQVAASLIYTGQVAEGLEIVAAVQDRYDGFRRNPFEHNESGVHYARAMASWSLLLALSGIDYDGRTHRLHFAPRGDGKDFSTFWSTGGAWGRLSLQDGLAVLTVVEGELALAEFGVAGYGNERYEPLRRLGAGERVMLVRE